MAGITSWQLVRVAVLSILFASCTAQTAPTDIIAYCSSENTGSDTTPIYEQWQTTGLCIDHCRGQYTVAVIQQFQCWCTNLAPGITTNTGDCNTPCPGYGDPQCGSKANGLYGYFLIDGQQPKGTSGVSSTSSSSSRPVSTIPSDSGYPSSPDSTSSGGSSFLTVSATQQSTRTSSSPVTSATVSQISSTTSVSSSTTTTTAATHVDTIITTVTGQVQTIVITPSSPADSNLGSSPNNSGSSISTGSIVGIVLGVALGIGLVIGLAVWFWFRRRHQQQSEDGASATASSRGGNNGIPSRQVSQMSSAGLLHKAPRIFTSGLPVINGPKSAESTQLDRRSLGTDQRLNPYAIYAHEESRLSNVSLQDNQDYSRQLRVANPDL